MKINLHWPAGMVSVRNQKGFTLVELMITVVVTLILTASVFATHQVQSTNYSVQRELSKMQQGLRGSLHVLEWDLHNGLRDPSPKQENRFTTTGTRWYNSAGVVDNAGQPGIEFNSLRIDNDGDGVADQVQMVRYQILQPVGEQLPGLYRTVNPDPDDPARNNVAQLVADGIQAIGFAFALDRNGDGALDRFNNNPLRSILWAVDSDNDGRLDAILDTNDDNRIDENDNAGVAGFIGPSAQLATQATYDQVRAVRIFLLIISERPFSDHMIDQKFYVVGNQVIQAPQDRFKRRLMTIDVALRNYIR